MTNVKPLSANKLDRLLASYRSSAGFPDHRDGLTAKNPAPPIRCNRERGTARDPDPQAHLGG